MFLNMLIIAVSAIAIWVIIDHFAPLRNPMNEKRKSIESCGWENEDKSCENDRAVEDRELTVNDIIGDIRVADAVKSEEKSGEK